MGYGKGSSILLSVGGFSASRFSRTPYLSRGDPRLTLVNETAEVHLALSLFPRTLEFPADAVLELVEPGLYKRGR